MEKKYLLIKDLGTAKAGKTYVRGLYEHPEKKYGYKINDLYWAEGSALKDWDFFHKNTISEQYFKPIK